MSFNNFTPEDIVERIQLVLPSRFTRSVSSELYKFLLGLAGVLKISSDEVDEVFRQTNLYSASGTYVDDYITGLSKLGRKTGESDDNYKTRYYNRVYVYNCSKTGLEQIVIDITGQPPQGMYSSAKRGVFANARYYYNDTDFRSTYGVNSTAAFTGYIQFKTKPPTAYLDELCKTINEAKAAGVTIYLFYPNVTYGYGYGGYGEVGYGT
jgi:hypothetical protein